MIHLIHQVESRLQISYSDESIDYLQTSICYLITRGLQPDMASVCFFEDQVKETAEYPVIKAILKEFDWNLSQSYLEWLTILFSASNVYENGNLEQSQGDQELARLITKMVSQFEEQTFIQIDDRQMFEKRLLGHLRPACFRIRYGLSLGIYSLESLVKDSNHAILIEMLKEIIQPIERWLGKAFPSDELELLSYYFGSQLSASNEKTTKPRAVVVCTNGVIVSRLMIDALRKLFPELHFLAAFSVREFYRFQADYEVVFTTVPLKTTLHQYILNPIMNYKEQVSLRYRVLKELGINGLEQTIQQLLQIIQKSTVITDRKQLKEDLQTFLVVQQEAAPLENFQILPSLISYIKPEYVQTSNQELSWEEAVDLACQPLLAAKVVNSDFIKDLKRQIASPVFCSYLGTQMSIPHTTAENGILKDGISFLVLKKPVYFPDGQKIHFLVPLAFHDLTKHLRAINQLASLSENKTLLTALLKGKEANDVYHILKSQY